MITTLTPGRPQTFTQSQVALHLMINQLSVSSMPVAIRRRSYLVNEIPVDLRVYTDSNKLATVLGSLINVMIDQSNDSCIRISAKLYGNVILVHIRDNNRLSSRDLTQNLGSIQLIAEKLGGTITINEARTHNTSIAFSFMSNGAAA